MEQFDEKGASVSQQPAAPHFAEEATLASARPVVPISAARAIETARLIRWTLPFVIVTAVIGALVGGGIGYYERLPLVHNINIEPQSPVRTSEELPNKQTQVPNERQSQKAPAEIETSGSSKVNESLVLQPNISSRPAESTHSVSQFKHETHRAIRATAMQRPRRDERRGAGRIQEIFAGSEP